MVIKLPDGWQIKALGKVCQINPSRGEVAGLPDDLDVSFVPMAAISEDGKLIQVKSRKAKEVKKGFPHFKEKDVLLAKITPCFENGKRWLAQPLLNGIGFGSTEFHVLRPTKEVLPEWVYYFVSMPTFREDGKRRMTGTAGQKRVPPLFLADHEIPVPPIPVQQQIVTALRKAEKLNDIRAQANQLTSKIIQSVFLKMFGDPKTNPKRWTMTKLGSLCKIRRGASPRPISKFLGGTVPWVKIGDGTRSSSIYIEDTEDKITKEGAAKSVFLKAGSLILANSGVSLGFARILKIDGCIHDGWLSLEDISPKIKMLYLLQLLNRLTNYFRESAPDGTQPNLNTTFVKSFEIPVPPMELQEKFSKMLERMDAISISQMQSTQEVEELFHCLMYKGFRGELATAKGTAKA